MDVSERRGEEKRREEKRREEKRREEKKGEEKRREEKRGKERKGKERRGEERRGKETGSLHCQDSSVSGGRDRDLTYHLHLRTDCQEMSQTPPQTQDDTSSPSRAG